MAIRKTRKRSTRNRRNTRSKRASNKRNTRSKRASNKRNARNKRHTKNTRNSKHKGGFWKLYTNHPNISNVNRPLTSQFNNVDMNNYTKAHLINIDNRYSPQGIQTKNSTTGTIPKIVIAKID